MSDGPATWAVRLFLHRRSLLVSYRRFFRRHALIVSLAFIPSLSYAAPITFQVSVSPAQF
jgi:hypothetical protein